MQCFTIYLFLLDAVHVSDGFSAHHQELKTAHTASGICLYVQFWVTDDVEKNRLKHVESLTEINMLWYVAPNWLNSANILAMHGPMNVEGFIYLRPLCALNLSDLTWKFHIDIAFNPLTPNDHNRCRTAPLTSKVSFYIFIQQMWVLYILNIVYTLRFFLFKIHFVS